MTLSVWVKLYDDLVIGLVNCGKCAKMISYLWGKKSMLWAIILEPLAEIFMPILQKLKTHHKYITLSILFMISLVLYYFGQNNAIGLELLPLPILAMVFLGCLIYKNYYKK